MNQSFFQRMSEQDQSQIEVDQTLKQKMALDLRLQSMGSRARVGFFARLRSFARPIGGFVVATALVAAFFLVPHEFSWKIPSFSSSERVDDWVGDHEGDTAATGLQGAQMAAGIVSSSGSFLDRLKGSIGSSGGNRAAGLNTPFLRSTGAPSAPIAAAPSQVLSESRATDAALGFSVGGAKDINNFRANIQQGYLPLSSDLTYEGLFYDYSFDTGRTQDCQELFCPSYTRALSKHPLTGQDEYYLSVGLNSNLKESTFQRPKTNFVVVLDISGSMGAAFDRYYYDRSGKRVEIPSREAGKTKMELASQSLNSLIDQLKPEDRLGIVLFSDDARVAKPLRLVRESDLKSLKNHISALKPTNGTNMSAGLERGAEMLKEMTGEGSRDGYQSRIIFITDAMPNQGEFGASGLHGLAEKNAQKGISMSFIGVGVDFQSELVEGLTKVRGANYISVHSAEEFRNTFGKEFDFLTTPLVYDLRLSLEGSGFAIDRVYGSPDADPVSGSLMYVRTLFPSRTENGETRGGIVILKLRKTNEQPIAMLRVTYENVQGQAARNEAIVSFTGMSPETFDGKGIQKGILLARYGELVQSWLKSEEGDGGSGRWERTSRPLRVSAEYRSRFQQFLGHFRDQSRQIGSGLFTGDTGLQKELPVLEKLSSSGAMGHPYGEDGIVTPESPSDDWVKN